MKLETIVHDIPPLYDAESRVLLLGSLPSPKSREAHFFYGHPRNRFWPVLAAVLGEETPETIEEKQAMCRRHHIALWDVIASFRIEGSSDSSIRDAVPTDLSVLLAHAPIRAVFCNGQTAFRLYGRYQEQEIGLPATLLPSTSPANAAYSVPRLLESWRIILPALQK